jgi:hypothetical protein
MWSVVNDVSPFPGPGLQMSEGCRITCPVYSIAGHSVIF